MPAIVVKPSRARHKGNKAVGIPELASAMYALSLSQNGV